MGLELTRVMWLLLGLSSWAVGLHLFWRDRIRRLRGVRLVGTVVGVVENKGSDFPHWYPTVRYPVGSTDQKDFQSTISADIDSWSLGAEVDVTVLAGVTEIYAPDLIRNGLYVMFSIGFAFFVFAVFQM